MHWTSVRSAGELTNITIISNRRRLVVIWVGDRCALVSTGDCERHRASAKRKLTPVACRCARALSTIGCASGCAGPCVCVRAPCLCLCVRACTKCPYVCDRVRVPMCVACVRVRVSVTNLTATRGCVYRPIDPPPSHRPAWHDCRRQGSARFHSA